MRKRHQFTAGLLTGVSALALAPLALAQAAAAPAGGAGTAAGAESGQVEQIVVTGSRVILNGNNSPTPVTVVSTQQLMTTTPATVVDGLQELPVFAGGRSPQTNPGNSSSNGAAHQLNLRNVGTTRTLILYDGRRIAPTSVAGEVNVDTIPQMLLQRVDVVTGGASAVYGSDAVAGVVNFITDKSFNGWKANAQAGVSNYGDGKQQKYGLAVGQKILGGRGHIEASYEFYNNDGIAWNDKAKRAWAKQVWTVQGAGTAANPYHLVHDTRLSSTSYDGLIKGCQTATGGSATCPPGFSPNNTQFGPGGGLIPFVHGAPTGGNGVESGGDGGYYYQASLVSILQYQQAFGRFDYDLTDDIQFYAEFAGTFAHNQNNHQTNELNRSTTISASNAFLSPTLQQQLAAANVGRFTFTKMFTNLPPLQPDSYTNSYIFNTGLNGKLGDYKWEASFVHNTNKQNTHNNYNLNQEKLSAALDAVRAPNGQIVCNVTLTNPGLYPGCVPLNVFGPGSESPDALAYILARTGYLATTKMDDVGGSISGSPFATWAGPVQVALSGEFRKTTLNIDSNALPTPANCTGLRFNCTASTLKYISNVVASAHGLSQSVTEGAVETDVPLLKDVAFAQALNVNGAFRHTYYDTSGGVNTWKLGVDWHVDDQVTLRGTRSRDIRAPNLNELFAPNLINPAGVSDLHTGIVGQAPFITSSNPNLVPEVALTWTAGVVLRPRFLPRFSLAIDYFKININNAITNIQGQNPTIQTICESSGGTSPFCSLIQRPLPFSDHSPANFVTAFLSQPQNAQSVETHGVDFEGNYQAEVGPGNLAIRVLGTYQPTDTTIQFPSAPVLNASGTVNLPRWRITGFLKYTWNNLSVDIQERWHGPMWWSSDRSQIYSEPNLPAAAYTNLSLTYDLKKPSLDTQVFLTIENLFNKQPAPYGNNGGSSGVPGLFGGFVPGVDDAIGRYFTVGVRLRH